MENKNNPTPEGYSAVRPYLVVESIEREFDFLRDVFEAEIIDSAKQPDGHYMHGEVRVGDSVIMMGRANEKFPPVPCMIYVYVKDAEKVFNKALKSGAAEVMPLEERFYGNKDGGIKDHQGNTWWIAQYLRKVPTQEVEKAIAEMMS